MEKGRIEFDDPTFRPLAEISAANRLPAHSHLRGAAMGSFIDGVNTALTNERPLNIVIHCPNCGMQHIDKPEPDICVCGHSSSFHLDEQEDISIRCEHGVLEEDIDCPCRGFTVAWGNPPHKTHLCHGCGTKWRPADAPTNGVEAVQTRGENDTWPVIEALNKTDGEV